MSLSNDSNANSIDAGSGGHRNILDIPLSLFECLQTLNKVREDNDNDTNNAISNSNNAADWILLGAMNGVRSWKSDHLCSKGVLFKSTTRVRLSVDAMTNLLLDQNQRQRWDPLLVDSKVIEKTGEGTDLIYLKYDYSNHPSYRWIWPREFCVQRYRYKIDDRNTMIVTRSVTHPRCRNPGYFTAVRGDLYGGGVIVEADLSNQNYCFVTLVLGIDAKGWVSKYRSIDLIMKHLESLVGLREYVAKMKGRIPTTLTTEDIKSPSKQPKATKSKKLPIAAKSTGNGAQKATEVKSLEEQVDEFKEVENTELEVVRGAEVATGEEEKGKEEDEDDEDESDEEEEEVEEEKEDPVQKQRIEQLKLIPDKYRNQIEAAVKTLMRMHNQKYNNEDGWEHLTTTKNVDIFKKETPGKALNSIKGHGKVAAPPQAFLDLFVELDRRAEWDPLYDKGKAVEKYHDSCGILYMAFKTVWPTTARDLCALMHYRFLDDKTLIVIAQSIETPLCPPYKGYVRAELELGGFVIQVSPENPRVCDVTNVTVIDLAGNLPTWLVNKVNTEQPMCIDGVRKILEGKNYQKYWQELDDRLAYLAAPRPKKQKVPKVKKVRKPVEKQAAQQLQQETPQLASSSSSSQTSQPHQRQQSVGHSSSSVPATRASLQAPVTSQSAATQSRSTIDQGDHSMTRSISVGVLPSMSNNQDTIHSNAAKPARAVSIDETIEEAKRIAWQLIHSRRWLQRYERKGVSVYRINEQPPGTILLKVKLTTIETSSNTIRDTIMNSISKGIPGNLFFSKSTLIEECDERTKIIQSIGKTTTGTEIEFVYLLHWRITADSEMLVCLKSVDHKLCPNLPNVARGLIQCGAFSIEPQLQRNQCSMIHVMYVQLPPTLKERLDDEATVKYPAQIDNLFKVASKK